MKQSNEERERRRRGYTFTALAKARQVAEQLAGELRGEVFEDWIARCVVKAQDPSEWTQARVLYESYLAHLKTYGEKRWHRVLAAEEAATETQWGRMMATLLQKKRRTAGWYYPLRLKRSG